MRVWLLFLCLALMPSPLRAQTGEIGSVQANLTYFVCTDPRSTPECVCYRESEKAVACPGCKSWKLESVAATLPVAATVARRERQSTNTLANVFARDMSAGVYGVEFPKTAAGYPVTTTMLFRAPEEYDWVEVSAENKEGTLAVWEGGAGLVVSDSAGELQIVYSSSKLGQANVATLESVSKQRRVKFLVPQAWLSRVSREE